MAQDIIKIFQHDTKNWIEKFAKDEWFFSKLRHKVTKNLSPEQAFKLIPDAVSLTLRQSNDHLCIEAFELLLELIKISNTAEINPLLLQNWEILINHVSSFGQYHKNKVEELTKWYRKIK